MNFIKLDIYDLGDIKDFKDMKDEEKVIAYNKAIKVAIEDARILKVTYNTNAILRYFYQETKGCVGIDLGNNMILNVSHSMDELDTKLGANL